MQVRSKKYILLISFVIAALIIAFSGCTRVSTGPTQSSSDGTNDQYFTPPSSPNEIQSHLPSDLVLGKLSSTSSNKNNSIYVEQMVYANATTPQGISSGNYLAKFPIGSIPNDMLVTMYVPDTQCAEVVFGPHPTFFNRAINIQMSYAECTDVPANATGMAILYWNSTLGVYENMGGTIDSTNKTVGTTTTHFSQYIWVWIIDSENVRPGKY